MLWFASELSALCNPSDDSCGILSETDPLSVECRELSEPLVALCEEERKNLISRGLYIGGFWKLVRGGLGFDDTVTKAECLCGSIDILSEEAEECDGGEGDRRMTRPGLGR